MPLDHCHGKVFSSPSVLPTAGTVGRLAYTLYDMPTKTARPRGRPRHEDPPLRFTTTLPTSVVGILRELSDRLGLPKSEIVTRGVLLVKAETDAIKGKHRKKSKSG